jgi:transposase
MYRFPYWAKTHWNDLDSEHTSQKISKLFTSVPEAAKLEFFRHQSTRCLEKEYLDYDTTSISSYSELIDHVKYGYNKDIERLPQINLALVFGEKSMLPVYCKLLASRPFGITTLNTL